MSVEQSVLADSLALAEGGARAFSYLGTHAADRARVEVFMHALEGWHEFYLLAGTAAVTLVGLLFVALSFHLDTLLHESRAHLLSSARLTFANFVYVLILSLITLVPHAGPVFLGMFIALASAMFLALGVTNEIRVMRQPGRTPGDRFMDRRRRVAIVGYLLGAANAMVLIRSLDFAALYNFVCLVCLLLGNAAWASWDLLVQVGWLKRSQEIADAEGRPQ